jgi:hypothetical protein
VTPNAEAVAAPVVIHAMPGEFQRNIAGPESLSDFLAQQAMCSSAEMTTVTS